jgi:hypothetical protein
MTDCRAAFTSELRGADLPVAGIKGSLRATGVGTGHAVIDGQLSFNPDVFRS